MYMINGCGTTLYGKTVVPGQEGYVATRWFCLLWTPIVPLGSYIVLDESGTDLFIWSNKSYRLIPIGSLYKPHLKAYYATILVVAFFVYVAIWSEHTQDEASNTRQVSDIVYRYNEEGLKLLQKGKAEEAAVSFSEALIRDTLSSVIWGNRGTAFYRKGEFRKATEDFSKAINLDSNDAQIYADRGDAYLELDLFDSAIHDYQTAVARDNANGYAHFALGVSYYYVDNYEQSIEALREAINLDYCQKEVFQFRGFAYLALEKNQEALDDANEVLSLDSQNPDGHLIKALALESAGYFGEAKEHFQQYLRFADSGETEWIDYVKDRIKEIGE